ncbi:hypothetical protein GWI33_007057 [Rhynchophorus ferrugineus]|uniref:Uncharacterized protein n=1 Tax=Rhynchophorus ferrugineus TaxID=354439 RepID=A0A834MD99_RHYFE|nr:hypothetical protein GWI33_007057 [Rhynchophorus ferrugineus]
MRALRSTVVVLFLSVFATAYGQSVNFSDVNDLLQVGGRVEITQIAPTATGRNLNNNLEDDVENFIKSNEILMEIPFGSTVTINGRSLDSGELDFKLRLGSGNAVEARKKSKIKKILGPILIVILLKAITLIPLALGVLGLKTWNALQLSFISFVTTVGLAVWKLCSKFSDHHYEPHVFHEAVHDIHVPHSILHHDHHEALVHHASPIVHEEVHEVHHDHIEEPVHHDSWDHFHRSDDAQNLAYNAYIPEN